MSSFESLLPIVIIAASLVLFFKWVGRDMGKDEKKPRSHR